MKKLITYIVITFFILVKSVPLCAEEGVLFSFEGSTQGWIIPDWAYYQSDHKAESLEYSSEEAISGEGSLKVLCAFPGDVWTAALVEYNADMDLSKYESISVDVYLPKKAPKGLIQARLILTVGIGWHFTEMRRAVLLVPGKWTKIEAKLESEEVEQSDWKGRKEKRLFNHIHNVKKIAVRIEYNASPPYRIGRKYHGPIYIDNLVVK